MEPQTEPLAWHPIGNPDALTFDPGAKVAVAGRELALFRTEAGFRALDDSCPHQGASLAEGDQFADGVRCPWHGWKFDLETGEGPPGSRCVKTWPIRTRPDGQLEIGIPADADVG